MATTQGTQPTWHTTQSKELDKNERAIQNLMFSCIYICQEDLPLNNIQPVCVLLEKLDVSLLPAQVSGVSYRNNDAALNFIQHIASYLHEDIVEKVQASSVIGTSVCSLIIATTVIFLCRMDDGRVYVANSRKELYRIRKILGKLPGKNIVLRINGHGRRWYSYKYC